MKTSQILTITAGTVLAAGVGYALYFDHKRQTDPSFRKQLKKDSKKTKKQSKKQEQAQQKQVQEAVESAVRELRKPGALPSHPQEQEKAFMESITTGETLLAMGESQYIPAAIAFFKAVKLYPDPMSLLGILQKATPEPCLEIVIQMIAKDQQFGAAERGSSASGSGAGGAGGLGGGAQDPLAQLAGLAAEAPGASNLDEVDDEAAGTSGSSKAAAAAETTTANADTPPSTQASGPPSQASSQEWDKLSGTSVGGSGDAESDVTANAASSAAPPSNIEIPSQASTSTSDNSAFDFSSSGSFAPSPLFNKSNPLGGVEAAAAGAGDVEGGGAAPTATVDEQKKGEEGVQSESGV